MTNIGVEHCASFVSSQFQSGRKDGTDEETGVRRAVTISRQAGCGALAVAEQLVRYLQEHSQRNARPWIVFDRNLMEKVLEDHDLPPRLAQFLPEDRVSYLEDIMADLLQTYPPSQRWFAMPPKPSLNWPAWAMPSSSVAAATSSRHGFRTCCTSAWSPRWRSASNTHAKPTA